MRVWLENERHLIVEGEENFNSAGFVETQRAIPASWVELVPANRPNELEELYAKVQSMFPEAKAINTSAWYYGTSMFWGAQAWATEMHEDGTLIAIATSGRSFDEVLTELAIDAHRRKGE